MTPDYRTIHRAEVFDQLDAYGCSSAKIWLDKCDEVSNLRALVQVLVDGMAGHARSCVGTCSCGFYGRIASALIAAKEQGFVPTNTEDK